MASAVSAPSVSASKSAASAVSAPSVAAATSVTATTATAENGRRVICLTPVIGRPLDAGTGTRMEYVKSLHFNVSETIMQ